MKIRRLYPELILSIPCPTCDALSKQKCVLVTGKPRSSFHRDRRLAAADLAVGYRKPEESMDIDELMQKATELHQDLDAAEM